MSTELDALFDRNGRQIFPGDTLKLFHFIGPRRKRYYMYKWVESVVKLGASQKNWLRISHLGRKPEHYHALCDGGQLQDYEIVQGYGPDGKPYDVRPKHYSTIKSVPTTKGNS